MKTLAAPYREHMCVPPAYYYSLCCMPAQQHYVALQLLWDPLRMYAALLGFGTSSDFKVWPPERLACLSDETGLKLWPTFSVHTMFIRV